MLSDVHGSCSVFFRLCDLNFHRFFSYFCLCILLIYMFENFHISTIALCALHMIMNDLNSFCSNWFIEWITFLHDTCMLHVDSWTPGLCFNTQRGLSFVIYHWCYLFSPFRFISDEHQINTKFAPALTWYVKLFGCHMFLRIILLNSIVSFIVFMVLHQLMYHFLYGISVHFIQ